MERHRLTGVIALIVIFLTACGGPARSERPRVALLMKAQSNPFFQVMEKGARQAAAESNVDLMVQYLPTETAADTQVAQVEDAISKQVSAILIAPSGSSAIVPALLKANEAKIPVINLDNRIDAKAAAGAGLKVAAFVGPGNVDILEGIKSAVNAQQRRQGCEEALAQNPDVKLVASQTANWSLDEGNTVFTDLLQAHPDINGLFAANDMMALGALRAIRA